MNGTGLNLRPIIFYFATSEIMCTFALVFIEC